MNNFQIARKINKLRNYSSSVTFLPPGLAPVAVLVPSTPNVPGIAHEVRNPLLNIKLALDMLKSLVRDEQQEKYLNIILRASARINDVVNELIKSDPEVGVFPQRISVQDLLHEVIYLNKDRIMLKRIKVTMDFTPLACNIMADKQKMKVALTNIVINAIEAMNPEDGELKLTLKLVNRKCIIEVEDNGIGISMDNLQHIFSPYFSRKTDGIGLGLATTMETLFSNHGRVTVQSEEGMGTRFILSFNNLVTGKFLMHRSALNVL